MHGGNVNDFLDHATYEEVAALYNGTKYFFYGLCYDEKTKLYSFVVERCNPDGSYAETIYDKTSTDREWCLEQFIQTPIIDGKTFWQLEKDMTWIECC